MPRHSYIDNEDDFEAARHVLANNIEELLRYDSEDLWRKFIQIKRKWLPADCHHPTRGHRLRGLEGFKYLQQILLYPDLSRGWGLSRLDPEKSQIYDCFEHVEKAEVGSLYVKIAVLTDRNGDDELLSPSLVGYSFHT